MLRHRVEFEFGKTAVIVNRARLFVGQLKHLDATLDGQPIQLVEETPTAAA